MIDELTAGYHRFRQNRWPAEHAEYEALAVNGQKPHTLVVACSDSRADPALIFDTAPGELFVVRNVANLVPPYQPDGKLHGVSAALEFGVNVLGVKRIVVMGHASCGGVQRHAQGLARQLPGLRRPLGRTGRPDRAPRGRGLPRRTGRARRRGDRGAPVDRQPAHLPVDRGEARRRANWRSAACISASPTASCPS